MMNVKGRARIIQDIVTVDQAIKAEKDVESGYHGVVDENINYWLAVEEDIVESYTKLMRQSDNKKVKATLADIIGDSKNHIRILTSIRKGLNKIAADEQRHGKLLHDLAQEAH